MGRGRGKRKKLSVKPSHEDPGNDGEELLPACKRRAWPQKTLKEEIDEEAYKFKDNDEDDSKDVVLNKEVKGPVAVESGKKRKRYSWAKERDDSVQEENGAGARTSNNESLKSNRSKQNISRRKSKPQRAAESIVECK